MKTINSFGGVYRFLSNFHESAVWIEGIKWKTVEHYYQAMKTKDKDIQGKIFYCSTPGKAKRLGAKVELRSDWEEIKEVVMLTGVGEKFKQNSILAKRLINTGDAILVEGNRWHDNIWGNCLCDKCKNKPGKNLLGKILMDVRKQLRGS